VYIQETFEDEVGWTEFLKLQKGSGIEGPIFQEGRGGEKSVVKIVLPIAKVENSLRRD